MFKPVPGNFSLKISLEKKFVDYDELECTPLIQGERVRITMYGQERWVDLTWLSLIAHYEIYLPKHLVDRIWTIQFTDANPRAKVRCEKIPVVKEPLQYDEEFRIIPGFFRYAVSKEGKILHLQTKEIKNIVTREDSSIEYPSTSLYDPDRKEKINVSAHREIMIHRLVAFAWVRNPNPYGKWMVNHIDGNKDNYHYSNLEWVTPSENNNHAIETGLRSDSVGCKIRNVQTGEVIEFVSLSKAGAYMGLPTWNQLATLVKKTKHKLISDLFELRLNDDPTPWYYETFDLGQKSGRYHLHITHSDGRKETIPDVRTFKKKFGVWNCASVQSIVEKAKQLYPDMEFEIEDLYNTGTVQARNLQTNEVIEAPTAADMAKKLNCLRGAIQLRLESKMMLPVSGHVVRYKTDEQWPEKIDKDPSSPKCIKATKTDTDEQIEFPSLKATARHFQVDRDLIKHRLKTGNAFKGWKFEMFV